MRLVTFLNGSGQVQAGILSGDEVSGLGSDMLSVCASGNFQPVPGSDYDLPDVRLLAPIPRPPKFICVGLNYRDHAAEARMELPKIPTIFSKFSNTVIGPGEPIILPRNSARPDYEAEFAFVI